MGESFGRYRIGNDDAIFPYISSCNIACGFHGGDPIVIERTLLSAIEHNVRIGAHPSYPDRQGFGRRYMHLSEEELRGYVRYQVAVIKALAMANGGTLEYVKPHGALYNRIASNRGTARVVYESILELDPELKVMGLAGSHTAEIAAEVGVDHIAEAFADRRYEPDGQLRSRSLNGAVIEDPDQAAQQVLDIVIKGEVRTFEGKMIPLKPQSICIHGDTSSAVAIARRIDQVLKQNSITRTAR